jgi:hypothetical protein
MSTSPRRVAAVRSQPERNPIPELAIVRTRQDVEADGCRLPRHIQGTVVAVYGGGTAYAVEIAELPGGPEVVTLRAEQIERVR